MVPHGASHLFINATRQPREMDLEGCTWRNVDGRELSGSIRLEPFTSAVLVLADGEPALSGYYTMVTDLPDPEGTFR